jgi:hypothetical protein
MIGEGQRWSRVRAGLGESSSSHLQEEAKGEDEGRVLKEREIHSGEGLIKEVVTESKVAQGHVLVPLEGVGADTSSESSLSIKLNGVAHPSNESL